MLLHQSIETIYLVGVIIWFVALLWLHTSYIASPTSKEVAPIDGVIDDIPVVGSYLVMAMLWPVLVIFMLFHLYKRNVSKNSKSNTRLLN